MLELQKAPDGKTAFVEFLNARLTASIDSDSARIPDCDDMVLVVYVPVRSGTTPTLVVSVETSEEGQYWVHRHTVVDGATEGDLTRTTAPTVEGKITATGTYSAIVIGGMAGLVRLTCVLGGTDPVFNVIARGYFKCRSPNLAS